MELKYVLLQLLKRAAYWWSGAGCLLRADPVAMKAVGHAMAEMHQRDGTCFDIPGVEHGKVAAVPERKDSNAGDIARSDSSTTRTSL